jgi:hypothetical protein
VSDVSVNSNKAVATAAAVVLLVMVVLAMVVILLDQVVRLPMAMQIHTKHTVARYRLHQLVDLHDEFKRWDWWDMSDVPAAWFPTKSMIDEWLNDLWPMILLQALHIHSTERFGLLFSFSCTVNWLWFAFGT